MNPSVSALAWSTMAPGKLFRKASRLVNVPCAYRI
jgi:hypothetical protein